MLRQHASGRLSCFKRIDIDELYRRWRQRDATAVLDVRDDQEWASAHIPGAQHLHVGDVPQHLPRAIAHDAQHCHRIGDFDARLRGPCVSACSWCTTTLQGSTRPTSRSMARAQCASGGCTRPGRCILAFIVARMSVVVSTPNRSPLSASVTRVIA